MKKMTQYNKDELATYFLGQILLALVFEKQITEGNCTKIWNKLRNKNEPLSLQTLLTTVSNILKKDIKLRNFYIASNKDGKYAPVAFIYIDNMLLPPSEDIHYEIFEHLDEAEILKISGIDVIFGEKRCE